MCEFSHVGYPLSRTVLATAPDVGVKKPTRKRVHGPGAPAQTPTSPPAGLVLLSLSLDIVEHQGVLACAWLRLLIYGSVVYATKHGVVCHPARENGNRW